MKKMLLLLLTVFCLGIGSNNAYAQDYWIHGQSGYNYYIDTDSCKIINGKYRDQYATEAKMKEVSPSGGVYQYMLYVWETPKGGSLSYSTRRQDVFTSSCRYTEDHNSLMAKVYQFVSSRS